MVSRRGACIGNQNQDQDALDRTTDRILPRKVPIETDRVIGNIFSTQKGLYITYKVSISSKCLAYLHHHPWATMARAKKNLLAKKTTLTETASSSPALTLPWKVSTGVFFSILHFFTEKRRFCRQSFSEQWVRRSQALAAGGLERAHEPLVV